MSAAERTASRLEAFSDGVIAVIVTIMVLELRVPHEDGLAGLMSVVPHLGIYLLSFLTVAIYWVNHHELCRRVHSVSYGILWTNLIWLFALSLIPYFTQYISEKHFDAFSTAVYGSALVLAGFTYGLLRLAIVARQKASNSYAEADREEARKHILSVLCYAIAIPMAYWSTRISLVLDLLVTLIWIIPSLGTRTNCETPHPHATTR